MSKTAQAPPASRRPSARTRPRRVLPFAVLAALIALLWASTAFAVPVQIRVQSAIGANEVTNWKYLINRDDSGDPHQAEARCRRENNAYYPTGGTNPDYPDGCTWPSIRSYAGGLGNQFDPANPGNLGTSTDAPQALIVAEGEVANATDTTVDLQPGFKYLVSVLADGHKIDGTHFSVTNGPNLVVLDARRSCAGNACVPVEPQKHPLPLATIRVKAFHDFASVNGEFDAPAEDPADAEGLNFGENLSGFTAHIADRNGEVTTDWFGNPLCTRYRTDQGGNIQFTPDGSPIVARLGEGCVSDRNGDIVIPDMGQNRYAVSVVAPHRTDGRKWVQTSTLEGNHDWDIWLMEGDDGYDHETATGTEGVARIQLGFALSGNQLQAGPSGSIKGTIDASKVWLPLSNGTPIDTTPDGPHKLAGPIPHPWIALADLNNNDTTVFVGQGDANGHFTIANVPDGDYLLSSWDEQQDYILRLDNVSVQNGKVTDMGTLPLSGWWSTVEGDVFVDTNQNGKRDPGEQGAKGQDVVLRGRDNTLQEGGTNLATTDANGHYVLREAYPLASWVVLESFNDRFKTTGYTYQADNQPTESTVLTQSVDFPVFNIIGLSSRVDIGVVPYKPDENGGIVGTVTYDTTRNELDPALAATEDYQPGIAGATVTLFKTRRWADLTPTEQASGQYDQSADGFAVDHATGAYVHGDQVDQVVTDTFHRPTDCVSRNADGVPVDFPFMANQAGKECVEGIANGNLVAPSDTPQVNGNFGFGDLPNGDYIVQVDSPKLPDGTDMFKVTREEDVNIFTGDAYAPGPQPQSRPGQPPCVGPLHTVHVTSQDFLDGGGSPFEGQSRPLCNQKLITVSGGHSVSFNFNMFSDVPLPGRFMGLVVDDLNVSTNPNETLYGDKAGIPNLPVGIYDYTNRLVETVDTDPNGFFEAMLPSTGTYNCPLPAGPCPGMYRFVANDPGQPTHPNANYNPSYRVISTNFQMWPGVTAPADLAPTTIALTVEVPGSQLAHPAQCNLPSTTPQLLAVDKPFADFTSSSPGAQTIVLEGEGFGASPGTVRLTKTDNTAFPSAALPSHSPAQVTAWSDTRITLSIRRPGTGTGSSSVDANFTYGPYRLAIVGANGQSSVNGLTVHVLGGGTGTSGYQPTLYQVDPNLFGTPNHGTAQRWYATIQDAATAAGAQTGNGGRALVVVYPGAPASFNPLGAYDENLVLSSPVKLQGVGPGGVRTDGSSVPGSIIDGSFFAASETQPWYALVDNLFGTGQGVAGNQTVYEGATISVFARRTSTSTSNQSTQFTNVMGSSSPSSSQLRFRAQIDGFTIQGGNQMDLPGTINQTGGGPAPNTPPAGPGITQGGGIFVNGYARYLQVSNNVIKSNGGEYGGALRVGTPDIGSNNNQHLLVSDNQVLNNGGTRLAGAIGIFNGADGYQITHNEICGNFSAEYGGGVSHFGYSPGGSIDHNRIYFNGSYDEGGGVIIAGEPAANPSPLSQGAGAVDINNNVIQSNIAGDDGGGLRFLMAGNFPFRVHSDVIANNVSAHEGGGIAIDDAPQVAVYNSTIVKNITTATATTSNGAPAPAGLSTTMNSAPLQASLGSARRSVTVTFTGALGTQNVGQMTGNAAGIQLQAGGSKSISVSTAQNGQSPVNEVQQLGRSGSFGSGSFQLTFNGQQTAPIPYNATSATVQAALQALSTIGAGNVGVAPTSGPASGTLVTTSFRVTFQGALGNANQSQMTETDTIPGGSVNVTTPTQGSAGVDEVQTVTPGGSGTWVGGTFTLTFQGRTTGPIPFDAAADQVRDALVALSNIGPGDVTVTGGPLIAVAPEFSRPTLVNDVFSDNRAGSWDGVTLAGIGLGNAPGDNTTDVNPWDIGVTGAASGDLLAPVFSVLQQGSTPLHPYVEHPSNTIGVPTFVSTYNTTIDPKPWRTSPTFVASVIVALDVPPTLMGDYHLDPVADTVAKGHGPASSVTTWPWDSWIGGSFNLDVPDIDAMARPIGANYDAGADEVDGANALSIGRRVPSLVVTTSPITTLKAVAPSQLVPAGKAPTRKLTACTRRTCKATLQVYRWIPRKVVRVKRLVRVHGKRVRRLVRAVRPAHWQLARTVRMKTAVTKYRVVRRKTRAGKIRRVRVEVATVKYRAVTKRLPAGRWQLRTIVRNTRTHRTFVGLKTITVRRHLAGRGRGHAATHGTAKGRRGA